MRRRSFLKALAGLSAAASIPWAFDRPPQQYRRYERIPPCTTPLCEGKTVGWRGLTSVVILDNSQLRVAIVPEDCING